jgi:hypothetical protein
VMADQHQHLWSRAGASSHQDVGGVVLTEEFYCQYDPMHRLILRWRDGKAEVVEPDAVVA